jgi:hypothetical protein
LNRLVKGLPFMAMAARPAVRWLSRVLPMVLVGLPLLLARTVTPPDRSASQSLSFISISNQRESLPLPVHDEATCAFCQAAAFAPHAGHAGAILPIVWGTEHHTVLAYDDRLTHAGSTSPPRSRGPPILL